MLITLIGMPGAGKTFFGREFASRIGYSWVDGDALIEKEIGMTLQQYINKYGNEEFRKVEERVLLGVCDDNLVLSTGGSAVYYPSVMEHCRRIGKTVYLQVGLPRILGRIGDYSQRGIVLAPGSTIADLYRERTALYEKYADVILPCDGDNYSEYQEALRRILGL